MDSSSAQDRHLPASQRKIERSRERGQVARSRELANFAVLGAGTLALMAGMSPAAEFMRNQLAKSLRFDHRVLLASDQLSQSLGAATFDGLLLVLAVAAVTLPAAVLAALASGGFVFSMTPLAPDFSRLNPLSGLARMFSARQFTQAAKMAVLCTLLLLAGGAWLAVHFHDFTQAPRLALPQALAEGGRLLGGIALAMIGMLAASAAIDLPLQRWLHLRELRMSHQEIKEENKEANGNPLLKGRQRARAREIAQRRMVAAVPKADLVVTNPTHYAVALRYDENSMGAPRVVAKGADQMALKIRQIAGQHRVPTLESPRLARALYAHAELEQEIPAALYTAVAQVLAYVYQLRNAATFGTPAPANPPEPSVPLELDPHHIPEAEA